MKNKFYLISAIICLIATISCNNHIEDIVEYNISNNDSTPSVVIYDDDNITIIKEGNPTVFEVEGFEISYFFKNKGNYSTEYKRGETIEVGWTIKNNKDRTDSIYANNRCIGSCRDINKNIYVGMSQIPEKDRGITGIHEMVIGGIDKIILKSQESFTYSYSYSTTLLDSGVNDFYYEPLSYSIGDVMTVKYTIDEMLPSGNLSDDVWGIWELQPTSNLQYLDDLMFADNVTRYIIRPNIKIYFKVL